MAQHLDSRCGLPSDPSTFGAGGPNHSRLESSIKTFKSQWRVWLRFRPASVWFGAGFDARAMKLAYAIVVDGSGLVQERQLGTGAGAIPLTPKFYK